MDSLDKWQRFLEAADGFGLFPVTNWVTKVNRLLTEEFAFGELPDVRGKGAVEDDLRALDAVIGNRAFCFKNAERTNRLLQLARRHINRHADVDRYAAEMRRYLDAGKPVPVQGGIRDEWGEPSLRPF